MERVVLHSDLNNCYASIECMLHPELRGKYIAVCGSTEDRHGIVLAKNQLAKKCGVKTGDVIWEAKQKCPQLTICLLYTSCFFVLFSITSYTGKVVKKIIYALILRIPT